MGEEGQYVDLKQLREHCPLARAPGASEYNEGCKYVALYFIASWCGPCHAFTPVLTKIYHAVPELEVIFVSLDRREKDFQEYLAHMPWHAIPFAEEQLRDDLSESLKVAGIPAVVVVRVRDCKVICENARSFLGQAQENPASIIPRWDDEA